MTLKEAISILTSHQKWRLGDEDTPMTIPSDLTDSIALILKYHSEKGDEIQQDFVTNIGEICDKNNFVKFNEMIISDQEISESANEYFKNPDARSFFKLGAQWYRNKLIKKDR